MVIENNYYYKKALTKNEELTPQLKRFCKELLTNEVNITEAAARAGYAHPTKAGSLALSRKSVQAYLAKHVRKMEQELQINFQWKVKKIARLIDEGIPDNKPIENPVMAKLALDGISELNKMQGDLAPTKTLNANINADITKQNVEYLEQFEELKKIHDKEY